MKVYIQVDNDGFIRDVITYEHGGYIAAEIPAPFPDGINSGCYKWDGTTAVCDEVRKAEIERAAQPEAERISQLEAENEVLKAQVAQTNTDLAAFMDYYFSNTP